MPNSQADTRYMPSTLRLSMELIQLTPNMWQLILLGNGKPHTMGESDCAMRLIMGCEPINLQRLSGLVVKELREYLISSAISMEE